MSFPTQTILWLVGMCPGSERCSAGAVSGPRWVLKVFVGSSTSAQITGAWGTHPHWPWAGDTELSCPCSPLWNLGHLWALLPSQTTSLPLPVKCPKASSTEAPGPPGSPQMSLTERKRGGAEIHPTPKAASQCSPHLPTTAKSPLNFGSNNTITLLSLILANCFYY